MIDWLKDLYRHRELLVMLTWREIVVRYKQSVMGFLWAILMPMLIVGAGVVVREAFSYVSGKALQTADLADVAVRAVPWAFFASALRFATNSLIGNANLVQKIYMPREIFPLAAVASNFVDFLVASGALALFLAFARIGLSLQLLWVPVLLLILMALTIGLSLLLSAASLFFRDVKYLVEVFLTFAIFITPVFFSVDSFARFRDVLLINPVSPILEGLAQTVAHHAPPPVDWVAYSAAWAAALLLAGLLVFKRVEPLFAESI